MADRPSNLSSVALDTYETAKRTGLAASTLRKWRLDGRGPRFIKMGAAVRYRVQDVDAWIAERMMRSTSQVAK